MSTTIKWISNLNQNQNKISYYLLLTKNNVRPYFGFDFIRKYTFGQSKFSNTIMNVYLIPFLAHQIKVNIECGIIQLENNTRIF